MDIMYRAVSYPNYCCYLSEFVTEHRGSFILFRHHSGRIGKDNNYPWWYPFILIVGRRTRVKAHVCNAQTRTAIYSIFSFACRQQVSQYYTRLSWKHPNSGLHFQTKHDR